MFVFIFFFFSSRRRHTRCSRDWSSDVCSSDLHPHGRGPGVLRRGRFGGARPGRSGARDRGQGGCAREDRKSVVEGKSVDLGGRRIIKKKKKEIWRCRYWIVKKSDVRVSENV